MPFKIIGVDNYARESVSDVLIVPYIRSEETANIVKDLLNEDAGDEPDRWLKVVPLDHKLHKFEP